MLVGIGLTPTSKPSKAITDAHVTFITMPDSAQAAGKHLRIGGQSKILMYNHESDDATLPDLSPQGIAASTTLKANTWQCIEYHLGTDGTLETWVGGNPVSGLTSKPNAGSDFNGQWKRGNIKPKVSAVYFGWESYGGEANTVWYDDIVVDSSRIGCYAKSK